VSKVIHYYIILLQINLLKQTTNEKTVILLAVAGLISFAACKSGETKVEATADTTAMEVPVDTAAAPAADTTVAQ
jgi:hypothetical protein